MAIADVRDSENGFSVILCHCIDVFAFQDKAKIGQANYCSIGIKRALRHKYPINDDKVRRQ